MSDKNKLINEAVGILRAIVDADKYCLISLYEPAIKLAKKYIKKHDKRKGKIK